MAELEKRGYLLENYRLFHLKSPGGSNVDMHYHAFCKLLMLRAGQGSYYIDGQHYLLRPGDIVLIGSHMLHKPELDGAMPYERIILYISPDYLRQLSTPGCDLAALFSREDHVLRLGRTGAEKLFSLAEELERELSAPGFGQEQLCDAQLIKLLVSLGRAGRDPHQPSPRMPESRRVREIMDYLDQNLTEAIDMDSLAERFFVSKYHMMRSFRQETGSTIYAYLTQKRLMLARQRMESGMSAAEACYSSGWRSYSSFTRACGKYYGTTPTGRAPISEEDYE